MGVPEKEKVDRYIEELSSPQKEICQKLRRLIQKNFPNVSEGFMEVPCYEDKFYMYAFPDHVNLGLYLKGLSQTDIGTLEGKGKLMRHIKIWSLEDFDEARYLDLMTKINNR